MLHGLRAHATGFAAKVLLAFLVMTFAIWGVGDMIRAPSHNTEVATVGGNKITIGQFQRAMHVESEKLQRQLGNDYSPELFKSLGMPQQILRSLITRELVRREAASLGLLPDDADVVRHIRGNPSFHNVQGDFEKSRFDAMLKTSGLSEKAYVESLRRDMGADMLLDSLDGSYPVPTVMARFVYAAREEQRQASLVTLSPGMVSESLQPDAKEIAAYYEKHKQEFATPESRKVSYVSFTAQDVRGRATVTDEAMKQAYNERIDEFRHPEKRAVEQLLFNKEEQAKKAYDALKEGKDFAKLAKGKDVLNKDAVSLGTIERSNLVEGAGDSVFALKEGEFTPPVQSPFGWHVFRVVKIQPESVDSFEEARAALEKEVHQQAVENSLSTFSNTLEDALAAGGSLKSVAEELGLTVKTAGPFTREGKNPNGGSAGIPDFEKFLEVAFKTDEKNDSPLASSKGGVRYLVHVDTVSPQSVRPLSDVRDTVISEWRKEERQRRLSELANDIAKKLADPKARDAVIAKHQLKVTALPAIKRISAKAGDLTLPEGMVEEIFLHAKGESTGAYPASDGGYIIAIVKETIPAAAPKEDADAYTEVRQGLRKVLQNELFEEYMNYLTGKHKVVVNHRALQALEE